jgi:hypothetical protein
MKKIIVIGSILAVSILLFSNINVNSSSVSQFKPEVSDSLIENPESIHPLNYRLEFPRSGLYFYISPFHNWIKKDFPWAEYKQMKNWENKPFQNETAMFIGGGVGVLPFYNISIVFSALLPDIPGKFDVYSDGEYLDTIYPEFRGPISARFYILPYYGKGFHRLKFITGDNSSCFNIDIQTGFQGFARNILPYLIK